MNLLQRAVPLPAPEVVVDILPGRQVMGHSPLGDAAPEYVQEAVYYLAQRVRTWAPPFRGITFQQGAKPLPLRIGQVGWVSTSVHTNELHPGDLPVSQHTLNVHAQSSEVALTFITMGPKPFP